MDDSEKPMSPHRRTLSLRSRLITALTFLVLVVVIGTAAWTYHRAFVEAKESQDGLLSRVAEIVSAPGTQFVQSSLEQTPSQSGLVVEELDQSAKSTGLPAISKDGLTTVATQDGRQRVMVQTLSDGRRIAVAQPIAVRDDAVHETLLSTMLPIVLGAPILIFVAWLVVTWALKPVDALRRELERRDDGALDPLPRTKVPSELAHFLDALETHHLRASEVLEGQRRFAAEAAHELRTPVAAVSLQAEHLLADDSDVDRAQRQGELSEGLARLRALCEQLLVLGDQTPQQDRRVPLDDIIRSVAGDFLSLADDMQTDVLWDLSDAGRCSVPEAGTRSVLQNLVGNAIRYAGAGGSIDVSAHREHDVLRLEVLDHGPGIREPERALNAFHREAGQDTPGTGLGLAIAVRTLARLGGELHLLPRPDGDHGTLARVTIPLDAPAEAP